MNSDLNEKSNSKIDIFDLLVGMYKGALSMIVPGILLVIAASAFFCFNTWRNYVPTYKASASFSVKVTNPLYSGQQYYNNSAAEQMAETFPHIVMSGVLGERVKEKLGISYMPYVSASAIGYTNIFTIEVTSNDPQLAYDVLNGIVEVYPSIGEFVVGPTTLVLISESGVPETPVSPPNYFYTAAKGALIGGACWVALAVIYYLFHQTVTDEEKLKKLINAPCLGKIPKIAGISENEKNCPMLTDGGDKFGFNECVRLLGKRVITELKNNNAKVLMVTSAIPDEGKTTVSINIAVALAKQGKRTLLVDFDLRNPSVGGLLHTESDFGFGDFLMGKCTLKEAFHATETENLFAVFGGKPVSAPEKLLYGKHGQQFMEAAKKTFDYVILDTPPCAMMADAAEIGSYADCVLLTVRKDFAVYRQIREAVQNLSDNEKPIIGTVLNMVHRHGKNGKYGGYNGYGYGYGYGSGYGYSYGHDSEGGEEGQN